MTNIASEAMYRALLKIESACKTGDDDNVVSRTATPYISDELYGDIMVALFLAESEMALELLKGEPNDQET